MISPLNKTPRSNPGCPSQPKADTGSDSVKCLSLPDMADVIVRQGVRSNMRWLRQEVWGETVTLNRTEG